MFNLLALARFLLGLRDLLGFIGLLALVGFLDLLGLLHLVGLLDLLACFALFKFSLQVSFAWLTCKARSLPCSRF